MPFINVSKSFPPEAFGFRLGPSTTSQLGLTDLFQTNIVPASGNLSVTFLTYDYAVVSAGFEASGALTISLQPYLDDQGVIPASPAVTSTQGASGVVQTPVDQVFRAITLVVSNAGGTPVSISNLVVVARSGL